jgi:acetylornithine/N-succinyldiaminopimelate aminotransferase
LIELSGAHQVTFLNSGAEANQAAIKLARKWGRLHKHGAFSIVTTHGAFHGRTLATMAASGKPGWDQLFPPNPQGFVKVPFGDSAAIEAAIDESTVAVMVEPIQGEAGVVVPPPGYLEALRRLCDAHDLLLIADEIQTGVGRIGRFLAQEHDNVRADITTLGKGLGGGVPVATVLANERAACFEPGDQGSTFGGNPLMTGAALVVVQTVSEPAFLARVREHGDTLHELAHDFGGAVTRGQGLLRALVFDRHIAPALTEAARGQGLRERRPPRNRAPDAATRRQPRGDRRDGRAAPSRLRHPRELTLTGKPPGRAQVPRK